MRWTRTVVAMGTEGNAGQPAPDPEGSPAGGPARRSGLGKPARVAILVVSLGGLLLLGLVVSNRNREAYNQAMTRAQVEAQAAGDSIDVATFWNAWARETTGQWSGDEARPARALVPELDGAELVSYTAGPTQVVIDYQIEAGGQEGCVRLTRTVDGTRVIIANDVCVKSFSGVPEAPG
jgi:hypothetical protein